MGEASALEGSSQKMLLPRPAMFLVFAVGSTFLIQQRQAVPGVPGDDQELLATNSLSHSVLVIWTPGNGENWGEHRA